jgi:hypothetical protein
LDQSSVAQSLCFLAKASLLSFIFLISKGFTAADLLWTFRYFCRAWAIVDGCHNRVLSIYLFRTNNRFFIIFLGLPEIFFHSGMALSGYLLDNEPVNKPSVIAQMSSTLLHWHSVSFPAFAYVCALLKIRRLAWISAFICKKQNFSIINTYHFIVFRIIKTWTLQHMSLYCCQTLLKT